MLDTLKEKVWKACSSIPKGNVVSYKELAEFVGSKNPRLIGKILGSNPNIPQVPCHRVVGSTGALCGYAKGLEAKKTLLQEEGVLFTGNKVSPKSFVRFNRPVSFQSVVLE